MAPKPNTVKSEDAEIETIGSVLEDYAARGVFRGFSRGPVRGSKATFRIMWHYDQLFELVHDSGRQTLRFARVAPDVASGSPIHKGLKKFIASRQSDKMPEHRRIDPKRAEIKTSCRGGALGLTFTILDGDPDYATRKFIHLVQEIYIAYLADNHYEYLVETFDLDPDSM